MLGDTYTESEYRLAAETCEGCWFNDPEYKALTAWGEMFRFGLDYLRRRDVGLEWSKEELSYREQEIIMLVHGEIESGKARRMKKPPKEKGKETDE